MHKSMAVYETDHENSHNIPQRLIILTFLSLDLEDSHEEHDDGDQRLHFNIWQEKFSVRGRRYRFKRLDTALIANVVLLSCKMLEPLPALSICDGCQNNGGRREICSRPQRHFCVISEVIYFSYGDPLRRGRGARFEI